MSQGGFGPIGPGSRLCTSECLFLSVSSLCYCYLLTPSCSLSDGYLYKEPSESAERYAKAAKAYKAKVASLTFEKAELRAWIQSLTEDVVKHKSDLKHTSTAKARVEDIEKKAIEGLRVVKDELQVVKEEFQVAREELCTKAATLDGALREASEAESSMGRLAEE